MTKKKPAKPPTIRQLQHRIRTLLSIQLDNESTICRLRGEVVDLEEKVTNHLIHISSQDRSFAKLSAETKETRNIEGRAQRTIEDRRRHLRWLDSLIATVQLQAESRS